MFPLLDVGILSSCSYWVLWKGWAQGSIEPFNVEDEPWGAADEAENGGREQGKGENMNNGNEGKGEIRKKCRLAVAAVPGHHGG